MLTAAMSFELSNEYILSVLVYLLLVHTLHYGQKDYNTLLCNYMFKALSLVDLIYYLTLLHI